MTFLAICSSCCSLRRRPVYDGGDREYLGAAGLPVARESEIAVDEEREHGDDPKEVDQKHRKIDLELHIDGSGESTAPCD